MEFYQIANETKLNKMVNLNQNHSEYYYLALMSINTQSKTAVNYDARKFSNIMETNSIFSNELLFLLSFFMYEDYFYRIVLITLLVIVLAASGASLHIREMYVKALLKLFEYATNIKQEKLNLVAHSHNHTHRNRNRNSSSSSTSSSLNTITKLNNECHIDTSDHEHDDPFRVEAKNDIEREKEIARIKALRQQPFMLRTSISSQTSSNEIKNTNSNDLTIDNDKIHEQEILLKKFQNKIGIIKDNKQQNENKNEREYKKQFHLGDICDFVHQGIATIIDDDVTKRFTTEELTVWNLLTRTNQQYEYVSFRVTILWLLGFIFRYTVLFPFRLLLFFIACAYTIVCTYLIGLVPNGAFKRWLNSNMSMILHRMLSRVFSAIITFHNRENRAKYGSICVANHTSPIDVIILSTDNTYSLIGQKHGGFTGMMQRAFSRASKHIWFDRNETKDRLFVSKCMQEHVKQPNTSPILIFPEGTCINNTSVMMFKKGCFEIDSIIYPVAIKYDPRFGDAFWNSQKHSMLQYLILMMTSWAIVVDVYYLPPMKRNENENVLDFTNRVKTEIVKKGSFVDLNWDGMLKRSTPKLDLMYKQQQKYVRQLKID